ncbi:hypothetical protein N9435_04705 [Pseudomonadales bacterium]|nr:hypothetical protein [Pseudomonadales bacterium]
MNNLEAYIAGYDDPSKGTTPNYSKMDLPACALITRAMLLQARYAPMTSKT